MKKFWQVDKEKKLQHLQSYLVNVRDSGEVSKLRKLIKAGASNQDIISTFEGLNHSFKSKVKAAYRQSQHRQTSNHAKDVQALIDLYCSNTGDNSPTLSTVCRWAADKLAPMLRDEQLKRQGVTIIRPNS